MKSEIENAVKNCKDIILSNGKKLINVQKVKNTLNPLYRFSHVEMMEKSKKCLIIQAKRVMGIINSRDDELVYEIGIKLIRQMQCTIFPLNFAEGIPCANQVVTSKISNRIHSSTSAMGAKVNEYGEAQQPVANIAKCVFCNMVKVKPPIWIYGNDKVIQINGNWYDLPDETKAVFVKCPRAFYNSAQKGSGSIVLPTFHHSDSYENDLTILLRPENLARHFEALMSIGNLLVNQQTTYYKQFANKLSKSQHLTLSPTINAGPNTGGSILHLHLQLLGMPDDKCVRTGMNERAQTHCDFYKRFNCTLSDARVILAKAEMKRMIATSSIADAYVNSVPEGHAEVIIIPKPYAANLVGLTKKERKCLFDFSGAIFEAARRGLGQPSFNVIIKQHPLTNNPPRELARYYKLAIQGTFGLTDVSSSTPQKVYSAKMSPEKQAELIREKLPEVIREFGLGRKMNIYPQSQKKNPLWKEHKIRSLSDNVMFRETVFTQQEIADPTCRRTLYIQEKIAGKISGERILSLYEGNSPWLQQYIAKATEKIEAWYFDEGNIFSKPETYFGKSRINYVSGDFLNILNTDKEFDLITSIDGISERPDFINKLTKIINKLSKNGKFVFNVNFEHPDFDSIFRKIKKTIEETNIKMYDARTKIDQASLIFKLDMIKAENIEKFLQKKIGKLFTINHHRKNVYTIKRA